MKQCCFGTLVRDRNIKDVGRTGSQRIADFSKYFRIFRRPYQLHRSHSLPGSRGGRLRPTEYYGHFFNLIQTIDALLYVMKYHDFVNYCPFFSAKHKSWKYPHFKLVKDTSIGKSRGNFWEHNILPSKETFLLMDTCSNSITFFRHYRSSGKLSS